MSIESYIQAMPKVELNARLEGVVRPETWMRIAAQNEVAENTDDYARWAEALANPDYSDLENLFAALDGWLQQPDDITRIVYDAGLTLSKQNIRYAELLVDPTSLMLPGMTFDALIRAISDGCDRVSRAWDTRIKIILAIPRSSPRAADDILRWSTGAAGRNNGVVALALVGNDDDQPVGQFERAFRGAVTKDLPRVVQAGNSQGIEGALQAISTLSPTRIIDGFGIADAPDALAAMEEQGITLILSIGRALCMGWVPSYGDYPLRELLDSGLTVVISADMPSIYNTNLSDEYLALVEHMGITLPELDAMNLDAISNSFLPVDERTQLKAEIEIACQELRELHLTTEPDTE